MDEIRFCRNCIQWHTTRLWKGNCWKHPWERDKYSQEASVGDCPDYVDKNENRVVTQISRLGIGSANNILTISGGVPAWIATPQKLRRAR